MTFDEWGVKRPAPATDFLDGDEARLLADSVAKSEKRARLDDNVSLPSLPAPGAPAEEFVDVLEQITKRVRELPFGHRSTDFAWALKRRVYALIPDVVKASDARRSPIVRVAAAELVDTLIRSGYAYTALDRRELVIAGAFRPCLETLDDTSSVDKPGQVEAVHTYVYLADHVNYYEDFSGNHPEFWSPTIFYRVLRRIPTVFMTVPEGVLADQWECICIDFEAALKTLGSFILFWSAASAKDEKTPKFKFDVEEAMPLLDAVMDSLLRFDAQLGEQISAKSRGDPLEEMTRLVGVLGQMLSERFEAEESRLRGRPGPSFKPLLRQGKLLLNFLVRILLLRIPTYAPKADTLGGGPIPVDERQQDSEWIVTLYERCDGLRLSDDNPVASEIIGELFKAMATMPLEEQRYRLECVSPMVPQFIAVYAEQLKQKTVPVELADLKTVINSVLQDDATVASELLDEISFYPCLLDFTTKRATIHSVCDRLKLHNDGGEPVRLVVPRDNVLDGVCDRLNLQDLTARIDAPIEIEFRAGYTSDTGNELADEGEDQGGLRRQWLDRASRYFISSDLFMSPSEDAAHLNTPSASTEAPAPKQRSRGLIYVPSPEPVCSCVQDDWQTQFELFGCVFGFAILYKDTVPVHLGHNFLRSVFGLKTDAEDLMPLLENIDKTLHTKLKYILSGGYKALGDNLQDVLAQSNLPSVFAVRESHCHELVETTPLKEGGDSIEVTELNKEEFVKLLLDRVLISGVARQVECFRRGLLRVVPDELVQRIAELLPVKEIELMVCGADEIDVDDWERHTEYENGYTRDSQPVRWFWEAVQAMDAPMRASLLSFATGSSAVPSGGFRFLQPELFIIQRVRVTDRYPEAHTCANTLDLPEYESKEALVRCLRFAIEETGDAFGRR